MKTKKPSPLIGRRVDPSVDKLVEWRSSKVRVAETIAFLSTPFGKSLMDVLYQRIPQTFPSRGQAITSEQACVELGRIEGFRDAIRVIESLAVQVVKRDPIEATYEAPE